MRSIYLSTLALTALVAHAADAAPVSVTQTQQVSNTSTGTGRIAFEHQPLSWNKWGGLRTDFQSIDYRFDGFSFMRAVDEGNQNTLPLRVGQSHRIFTGGGYVGPIDTADADVEPVLGIYDHSSALQDTRRVSQENDLARYPLIVETYVGQGKKTTDEFLFSYGISQRFARADITGVGSSNVTMTYNLDLPDDRFDDVQGAVIGDPENPDTPFNQQLIDLGPLPDGTPIGVVGGAVGDEGTIQRSDGTIDPLFPGTPIFYGDTVETFDGGSARIDFVDGTDFSVLANQKLQIDEYVYDDFDADASENYSILKKLFIFTGDQIRGDSDSEDEEIQIEPEGFGVGIRGSVEDLQRKADELEAKLTGGAPPSQLASLESDNLGVLATTASPVAWSTVFNAPDDPFAFAFDLTFLDPFGAFSVFLDDNQIYSNQASATNVNQRISESMLLDWVPGQAEMRFLFDGPESGLEMLLSNITLPGFNLVDYDNLYRTTGTGSLDMVYVTDEAGFNELARSTVVAVPLPATSFLVLGGLATLLLSAFRSSFARIGRTRGVERA